MTINSIIDSLGTLTEHKGNNIKKYTNTKDTSKIENKLYHQLLPMPKHILAQIQPFIDGRCLLLPATMPECMEVLHKEATDYMRVLFRTTVVSVTGFESKKLEVAEVQSLSEQNTHQVVTKSSGATRAITITFSNMYQDIPVFRYIHTWMGYVVTSGSYAGLYPHLTNLEYHEGNHSMSAYYIVPDPSFKRVEYGAFLYAMVPLDDGVGEVLDQTWGQSEVKPYPVQFKVHVIAADHPVVYDALTKELNNHTAAVTLNDWAVDIGGLS